MKKIILVLSIMFAVVVVKAQQSTTTNTAPAATSTSTDKKCAGMTGSCCHSSAEASSKKMSKKECKEMCKDHASTSATSETMSAEHTDAGAAATTTSDHKCDMSKMSDMDCCKNMKGKPCCDEKSKAGAAPEQKSESTPK